MPDDVAAEPPRLDLLVFLALDAGRTAEDHVETIVAPQLPSRSSRWGLLGGLESRIRTWTRPSPNAHQVRRACEEIDEFALALTALAGSAESIRLSLIASSASTWSHRLWGHDKNAAAVHGEIRSAMADLNKCHANLILGRSVVDGLD